ncbi:hypothetical protein AUW17_08230 [Tenacibaculum dicentrarchi]|nr:hypothetical protein AUW17_08230 [Tenacibaculum dicentrarchi]
MSRKVETTHLQVKSVKNAKVLGTNKDGFVIESDLDFLNYIPKDGAKGAKGDTGAKGADGLKGAKGDTGAKGADGLGLKGAKGDTGERGYPGVNGHGYPGKDGAMGFPGPRGAKGDTGAKGADGLKGTKGDTGKDGVPGPPGRRGPHGSTGAKGSDANSIDVQAGTNITIDKTNPLKPVINASDGTSEGTDLGILDDRKYSFVQITSSTGKGVRLPLAHRTSSGVMPRGFYEEGTFEPHFGLNSGHTFTSTGMYMKVGRMVFFSVHFSKINTVGTSNINLRVEGLPWMLVTLPFDKHFDCFTINQLTGLNQTFDHVSGVHQGGTAQAVIQYSNKPGGLSTGGDYQKSIRNAKFTNGTLLMSGIYMSGSPAVRNKTNGYHDF